MLIPTVITGTGITTLGTAIAIAVNLRRVVPTNMVHIVQTTKKTTSYGRGRDSGNTYYEWPRWVPILGVSVSQFPESNFQVDLKDYAAYDVARLPFEVDVTAFFRIDNAEVAAQRVSTFDVLVEQLRNVVQGSVRSVLASNNLEDIMGARALLAEQFTKGHPRQWPEPGDRTDHGA